MTEPSSRANNGEDPSRLDLYISTNSPDSDRAIDNLRIAVLARTGHEVPLISIIDVHASPLVAYREGIFVTPTLVITVDGVSRTMFGDLSDPDMMRSLLSRMS